MLALVLIAPFIEISNLSAQVTGMPTGYVTTTPTVSTAASPVWYNMMATNVAANGVDRYNRYMFWDGTNLKGNQFNSGINDAAQDDKYLWRLEQGTSGVLIINKTSGKRVFTSSSNTNNNALSATDAGTEWTMATASTIITTGTVLGQYAFYLGTIGSPFLMNVGDGITYSYKILIFNTAGSAAKSSGWFLYPVTTQNAITFAQPANGTVAVTATNGTTTPTTLTTGNQVLVGTAATVTLAPASGYVLSTITVNGADSTAKVTNNTLKVRVNAATTITTTYVVNPGTDIAEINSKNSVWPTVFSSELKLNSGLTNASKVDIFNIQGVKVYSATSNFSNINTTNLSSGCYLIKVYTAKNIYTQKIVKN